MNSNRTRRAHGPALSLLASSWLALAACGGGYDDGGSAAFDDEGQGLSDTGAGGRPDDDFGDAGADASAPEQEAEEKDVPPAASRRFLYIAVPSAGLVARIDSLTLAVNPIVVGGEPTVVLTSAETDAAVVLNRGRAALSLIESTAEGDQITEVPILQGCNQLRLSPDGRWAAAWFRNRVAEPGDLLGSLQEFSLIDVRGARAWTITVGFNVRDVLFSADSGRLLAVSDAGVSILVPSEIAADGYVAPQSLGDDPLVDVSDREVLASPSTRWVAARNGSESALRVLDTNSGLLRRVPLPEIPTDVDLVEATAQAIVAVREADSVAAVDLEAEGSAGVTLFSAAPAAAGVVTPVPGTTTALLHTTLNDDGRLGIMDLEDGEVTRVVLLRKGVVAVYPSPDGRRALVVHSVATNVDNIPFGLGRDVARSEAVSIVDLESGYAKLILLPTRPDDVLFTPESDAVFLLLGDAASRVAQLDWLDLSSFARTTVTLPRQPESMGWVAEGRRVFVALEDPAGRVTFVDADDGVVQEVSSFALNALVE
jgi:hypothetical protein